MIDRIHNEQQYLEVMLIIERLIWKAKKGGGFFCLTPEEDNELTRLTELVEKYEEEIELKNSFVSHSLLHKCLYIFKVLFKSHQRFWFAIYTPASIIIRQTISKMVMVSPKINPHKTAMKGMPYVTSEAKIEPALFTKI